MKEKKFIILFLLMMLLAGSIFISCRQFFLSDAIGYIPVYSKVIGPDGGTVSDPRGASVIIPAGALDEDTEITIKTYTNSAGISRDHGVVPFPGGADFGPDGLAFNVPVTITIPSSVSLVEKQGHALFTLSGDSWQDTNTAALPGTDTTFLTAEVDHFTPYVSCLFSPGLLAKFKGYYSGGDSYYPFMYFVSWFLNTTSIYGMTVETDTDIYDCVGVFFDLQYTVGGFEGQQQHTHGNVNGDSQTYLSESSSYQVVVDGAETQVVYDLKIQVHWETTEKVKAEEKEMKISITGPLLETRIEGLTEISTFASNGTDIITDVEFYANGSYIGTDDKPPFGITWDADGYTDGIITLTARANGISGESVDSKEIDVHKGQRGPEIGSWSYTTNLPASIFGHTCVAYNGYIYVIGGAGDSGFSTDVQYAKINSDGTFGNWKSTENFMTERASHTSVVHNGYLYILGGMYNNGSNQYLHDVQYTKINQDGSLGIWNSTQDFVTARMEPSSVVYHGYLYLLGGWINDVPAQFLNDVQYAKINSDGTLGNWNNTTSFPTARYGHSSVVNNGYLYVLGGCDDSGHYLNDVHYAKIQTNGALGSWNSTTAYTTGRQRHSSVVHNGYLYVLGGYYNDGSTHYLNDVQYTKIDDDGSLDNWNNTASFVSKRNHHTSIENNGYLYVIGGVYWDSSPPYFDDVQYAEFLF